MIGLLKYAAMASKDSDDPRTQIGSVVYNFDTKEAICFEANKLSDGFKRDDLNKFDKYAIMLHSEQAALYTYLKFLPKYCRRIGLAATAACCTSCAKAIVAAGVREVITSVKALEAMPTWEEEIKLGHMILKKAGVRLILVDNVGAEVLVSGEMITI